jgi:hypothetical protein
VWWVLVALLSACVLDRSGLSADRDAGGSFDAGSVRRDAGDFDGGAFDAGPRVDAGGDRDAGTRDSGFDADPCGGDPDRDGDGVADVCDSCPDDPGDDSDGDGSCDSMDRCPGSDDRDDGDDDAIPDGCDDWPCGTEPTVAASVSRDGVTIGGVEIGGSGRTAVVAGGAMVRVELEYEIEDCGCPGCYDQIEVGWVPGPRLDCVYDDQPGCSADEGTAARLFRAPMSPGTYSLRFFRAQDWSCTEGGRSDWWLGMPDMRTTVGVICVE